jgi:hypothetical protein
MCRLVSAGTDTLLLASCVSHTEIANEQVKVAECNPRFDMHSFDTRTLRRLYSLQLDVWMVRCKGRELMIR